MSGEEWDDAGYVRHPESQLRLPEQDFRKYKRAVRESIEAFFIPWLKGETDDEAVTTLRRQHAHVVESGYSGFYFGETPSEPVRPGVFRTSTPDLDLYERLQRRLPAILDAIPAGRSVVEVEGVQHLRWPRNRRVLTNVLHTFPAEDALEEYVDAINHQGRMLRAGHLAPEGLRALGAYYHVAINAHLFPRVNNALLMAQVNEVLRRRAMAPVSHGLLDHVAFVLPTEEFVKFFCDDFLATAAVTP